MSETSHDDLERDADLTARYRAAAQDAPPAALDDAIRAAARRAVGARPRPAGFSFRQSWRTSVSIAAVMVLSVSIVISMREEAPELTVPPRAEMPAADAKRKAAVGADEDAATTAPGFVLDPQRSKSIGLKPSTATSSTSLGMRQPGSTEQSAPSPKETTANRVESDAAVPSSAPARRGDAFATRDDWRDAGVAATAEQPRQASKRDTPQDVLQSPTAVPPRADAAKPAVAPAPAVSTPAPSPAGGSVAGMVAEKKNRSQPDAADAGRVEREAQLRAQTSSAPVLAKQAAEGPSAPVSAAKAEMERTRPVTPAAGDTGKLESFVDLPPEKWLERIEELRKQGRNEDAKASLAAFRKRYPEYRLPDSLRDWAKQ